MSAIPRSAYYQDIDAKEFSVELNQMLFDDRNHDLDDVLFFDELATYVWNLLNVVTPSESAHTADMLATLFPSIDLNRFLPEFCRWIGGKTYGRNAVEVMNDRLLWIVRPNPSSAMTELAFLVANLVPRHYAAKEEGRSEPTTFIETRHYEAFLRLSTTNLWDFWLMSHIDPMNCAGLRTVMESLGKDATFTVRLAEYPESGRSTKLWVWWFEQLLRAVQDYPSPIFVMNERLFRRRMMLLSNRNRIYKHVCSTDVQDWVERHPRDVIDEFVLRSIVSPALLRVKTVWP